MKRISLLVLAVPLAGSLSAAERTETRPLPFLSDDYPKALTQARARDVPLFVEAWAPW